jgi:hypothetical protein
MYQRAYGAWPMALELAIWLNLAIYAVLLCRWSRTRMSAVFFPLALLLGVALWPGTQTGFLLIALGIFSWMRSGICFKSTPLRSLTAELATVLGGGMLVAFWWPNSIVSWALAVWIFFLVQSVYFFIIPIKQHNREISQDIDPFERARREAERVLEGG